MASTSLVQRHTSRAMQPYRHFRGSNPVATLVAPSVWPWALGIGAGLAVLRADHELQRGQARWLARQLSEASGKPILSIGAKCDPFGDTRCDLIPSCEGVEYCDAENLAVYGDKTFGVAYMSHVLEHVPDPELAVREASRVADNVVAVMPTALHPEAWLYWQHRWQWVGENPVALGEWRYGIVAGIAAIGLLWWAGKDRARA